MKTYRLPDQFPWRVTDEEGMVVAQFKNKIDAELFMYARPAIKFNAPLPPSLAAALAQETA